MERHPKLVDGGYFVFHSRSHCFSNTEVRDLERPIHSWWSFVVFFFPCMLLLYWQDFWNHFHAKKKTSCQSGAFQKVLNCIVDLNSSIWCIFCVHNTINYNKILNTTGCTPKTMTESPPCLQMAADNHCFTYFPLSSVDSDNDLN